MVTSPGSEPTRASVAVNLASVCAEIGQRVVIVTTDDIDARLDEGDLPRILAPLADNERDRQRTGPLSPEDVQDRLEDTSVRGVSFLALQHFVAHTSQVVIRIPEVLDALRDVVDVVILDVPSFLSVHHGQGLAPLADLVLIVGERRLTTTDELRRTSAVLRRLGAPVVGMALTTGASIRDDDEEWDDEEWDDEDHDNRRQAGTGRWRARKRPSDEVDDDGAMNGQAVSRADATTATDAKPFVADLVDQTPMSLATPSDHRALWDVPPRPEA
jgi:Mrp family chromosome partitioning ATPase